MRLLIKEYLAQLKESNELDKLLTDLLLMMDFDIISHPQMGVRQYGVDILAKGIYKQVETILIFTVKRGDIIRSDWDSTPQSIRSSLNEIKDVYITRFLKLEYKKIPKKIILATGGILKSEIKPNWDNYSESNTIKDKVEYEFWGGDTIAKFIENHMLNEHVFPHKLRSDIRKSLALIADPDYELNHFYNFLNSFLLEIEDKNNSNKKLINEIIGKFRTLKVVLGILYHWAKMENNIKPVIYCFERALLNTWEMMRKNRLFDQKKILSQWMELRMLLLLRYNEYVNKISKHCVIQNGIYGRSIHSITENINVFEQLGIISVAAYMNFEQFYMSKDDRFIEIFENTVNILKKLINNHKALLSPYFDSNINGISNSLFVFALSSEKDFVKDWIIKIVNHIFYAYQKLGKYFPISTDSVEDLIAISISEKIPKEKLFNLSTMLPILAQWSAILDLEEPYLLIKHLCQEYFTETTLQIWYPDDDTEKHLYIQNAGLLSGSTDAPYDIPESVSKMKEEILNIQKITPSLDKFSSLKMGVFSVPLIATRHFKTPPLPLYWQSLKKYYK